MQKFIDVNSLIYLCAITINLGLSIFIFFKNRKSEINRSFGLLIFFVAAWTLSLLLILHAKSPAWLLLLRRFSTFNSSLIVAFFLYFSLVFPKADKSFSLLKKFFVLFPGFVFAGIAIFTPLMIKGFISTDPTYPFLGHPVYGVLYPLATLYYLAYVGLSLLNLIKNYIKAKGKEKLQIFYVLFGGAIAGLGALTTALVLPILGFSQFSFLGPPLTFVMSGFVVYAMIAYRLLDIEDFLSKGILYLALAIGIVGTFTILQLGRLSFIPSFYIALFNFALAAIVYFQNRKNPINVSFSAVIFIVAIWAFSIGLFLESREIAQLFFWSKIFYLIGAWIPSVILYFSIVFPTEWPHLSKLKKFLIFVPSILLMPVVLFSSQIVKDFHISLDGIDAVIGPFYPYYALFYGLFMSFAFINMLRKYRNVSSVDKIRIRYVIWGFAIVGLIGTIFNLILPWIGNYRLIWVGPYSTIFLSGLISYAIVVHRLMSVEVVAQRAFIYTIASGMIMALYAVAVIFSEQFFRGLFRYSSLFLTGLTALIIAVTYQPLVRGLWYLTDRLFFRGRYDYRKTLREISQRIASVIKIEELTKLIVSSFIDTMKISEISFLLLDKEKEHFRSVPISLPRYNKIEIDVDSPIVSWLNAAKDILVRDEIEDEIGRQEALGEVGNIRKRSIEAVRDEMAGLGISVWVPIISKEELIGIIALGDKLSGDIFSTEDIGLLSTLGNQTAVALDNARLYDEVVNMKDYSEEILQSMITGVMTVDTREKIVTFNSMAERITGRKKGEVLGKSCEDIWGKRGTIPNVTANSLKDRCYINFESSIASPERGLVPVAFTSTVLRDHQGKKIGALLTIRDLSEVKELEEKVRRADKLTALATMAAGMAHEIKNPLSSMKVLSQLLPKKYDDAEFRKKMQEIVPREINRIDRIVESLLSFARATALTFEKANVNDLLEENVKYFQDQAKAVDVKIIIEYAELPEIELDKGQLSQVFSNLMLNAIQAMSEGGELKVVSMQGKKIMDQLQTVIVKISDSGHGMPEETVNKLFDPFFTTKYGGTGLGLTISHNIVDGHRGYIDVESKVGKGTTFTITLPVSQGLV